MNGRSLFRHGVLLLGCGALAFTVAPQAHAYALLGGAWPTGTIPMKLQLDATAPASPALPLTDGTTSWNAVAQSAMDEWNQNLTRTKFAATTSTSTAAEFGDQVNTVVFSNTIYGQAFDSLTLAVTLVDHYDNEGYPTVRSVEADMIVNNARAWNSYRGAVRSNPTDLRRVILHELGHVLGLDHPDQAVPTQFVSAIMNSTISNLEVLQTDDRNGVASLYNTTLLVPTLSSQPTSQAAAVGSAANLTIGVNGLSTPPTPGPLLSYKWYFKASGSATFEKLFTLDSANLTFGSVQLADAGSYYVEIMTPDTTVKSNTITLTVTPVSNTTDTQLVNLSTRGIAGAGSSSMIVGFAITGSKAKTILLRAVGPTLGSYGVSGTLSDPVLTLVNQNAPSITLATSVAPWDQNSANAETIRTTAARLGAFPLPAGSKDAVILTTLSPGTYTAKTSSTTGNTGVVLVEAYDADASFDPTSRLSNLSTRGYVGTGGNLLIAGFSVQGPGPRTYLIRVAGPTLTDYGVTGTLYDPYLKLYQSANGGSVFLRETDDWDSPATGQQALRDAFTATHAFSFTNRRESAMLVTLQPGSYTAQASGNDNSGTTSPTGNALIEIYEVP